MKIRVILQSLFIILLFLIFFINLNSQRISTTKHNLSSGGSGTIKASSESEICIFCHTPHAAKPRNPLWNRDDPGITYSLYQSTTLHASLGQPDGSSVLCLSCHDGTIALGKVASRSTNITFNSGITTLPSGRSNLGTDLRNDHPISFLYNAALAAANGELRDPSQLSGGVTLSNSKVQCTSCHDSHYSIYPSFLVASTQRSGLCTNCHIRTNWSTASHATSTRTWNGSGTNPWPHTSYTTVQDNACENCHNPHNAVTPVRLLNQSGEENNCISCHNGNAASVNVWNEFASTRTSKHDIASYLGVHDMAESTIPSSKHVECTDCHNPHQAASNSPAATAPNASRLLRGVKGINLSGNAVTNVSYEYEICFKCHSSASWRQQAYITRQIVQTDTRLEFQSNGPSFHPVAAPRGNSEVPSLISPWSSSSYMYCTDCHSSADATSSQKGPHGSIYSPLLKKRYKLTETNGQNNNDATDFALCYTCHDRNTAGKGILQNMSFRYHSSHVVDEGVSCSTCHDSHGISSSQGNSTNNSHLINFNTSIVSAYNGVLRYDDTGVYHGRCTLVCHGKAHDPYTY
ncbi:MAG: multiheme c-type cytochrome [Candidatus Kapabacteria bacterium]|nr:multiheme c-type cytochrome [Candidatus Kapabacteria bacterium]